MALLFYNLGASVGKTENWLSALKIELPDLELRVWPEHGDLRDITYALVWMHEPGFLNSLPNLKAIFSLGAGVEHVFRDPDLPAGIPVVRLIDRLLTAQMVEYVVWAVLAHHRRALDYAAQQADARWAALPNPDTERTCVGVLGLGEMGGTCAQALRRFGFRVAGWSRSAKTVEGVESFHGTDGLEALLRQTDILVCLLPHTPETAGIINARTLGSLPDGAAFVSVGRGAQVIDADLLAALDSGRLSGATLDVFNEEPLPADHPYWRHPRVVITPHIASETVPRSAARMVADNIRRAEAGKEMIGVVDAEQGY